MRRIKKHKVYRHFKGKLYVVEDIAIHSDTGEKMVVYRQLYDKNELYVRPYDMFNSPVDKKKYPNVRQYYRFDEIKLIISGWL